MKNILIFIILASMLGACNLSKDIEVDLPEYTSQPVVECYLEPGKPFRLLLSRSYSYFDEFALDSTFIEKTLYDGALVTIEYNGQTDTLANNLSFELDPVKIFNYTGQNIVPSTPGIAYTLRIVLPNDRGEIHGQTTMLPFVPIDSIVVEAKEGRDSLFRVLTYFSDDQSTANYYRRLLNYASLDSIADQDYLIDDKAITSRQIAAGTGYELEPGDTVFNTIFHIDKPYYDFVESVQLAVFGNLSPFAQPSPIKSNVTGSGNPVGIFTPLVYDRIMTIIE